MQIGNLRLKNKKYEFLFSLEKGKKHDWYMFDLGFLICVSALQLYYIELSHADLPPPWSSVIIWITPLPLNWSQDIRTAPYVSGQKIDLEEIWYERSN